MDATRRLVSWAGWAGWTALAAVALHRGSFRLRPVQHRRIVGPWERLAGTLLLLLVAAAQALSFGLADAWGAPGGPDAADEIMWGLALAAGAVPLAGSLAGRQHYAVLLYYGLWAAPGTALLGVANCLLRDRLGVALLPLAAVGAYAAVLAAVVPHAFQIAGHTASLPDDSEISLALFALTRVYVPPEERPRSVGAWVAAAVARLRGLGPAGA